MSKVVDMDYLSKYFVKKRLFCLAGLGKDEEIEVCKGKISSMELVVSFVDYCYSTEVKGVGVRFSIDFNYLHFKERKNNVPCLCRFKKADRVKFRLSIAEVQGFLVCPKSFAFSKFINDNQLLKSEADVWRYISIMTGEKTTTDLIFSVRAVCLDFLVVLSSLIRVDAFSITSRGLLSLIMTRKKLHLIAKN
jgi:hypothetical protein